MDVRLKRTLDTRTCKHISDVSSFFSLSKDSWTRFQKCWHYYQNTLPSYLVMESTGSKVLVFHQMGDLWIDSVHLSAVPLALARKVHRWQHKSKSVAVDFDGVLFFLNY